MRFLSLCSGIEAASMAWHTLGWQAAAFAEIEPFPAAVLAHHYPSVPNLGDMTKFQEWPNLGSIDLVCGGTPCQSFSNAGLRAGLDDPRGQLMLTFGAIAARYRPKWLVWENVPGVLSSNGGRDFGAFLGLLGILGYGFAYRVLDAQFVRVDGYGRAVPQRRQRVFVVGCLGDCRSAAAVLLEREGLRGDSAPRREAGEVVAPCVRAGAANGGRGHGERSGDSKDELIVPVVGAQAVDYTNLSFQGDISGALEAAQSKGNRGQGVLVPRTAMCLNAKGGGGRLDAESETLIPTTGAGFDVAHTLRGDGFDASEDGTGRGTPLVPLAFGWQNAAAQGMPVDSLAPTLDKSKHPATIQGAAVRRLTPKECERLQGFPDDFTQIPWRGKPAGLCPDGPRYKAIGNSWAVNVARWVGRRIELVESIHAARREAA